MDKKEFEKKKSLIVSNGLSLVKGLEESFNTLKKYDWYEQFVDIINIDGKGEIETKPVNIKLLFNQIKTLSTELLKFPDELESLWERNFKKRKESN